MGKPNSINLLLVNNVCNESILRLRFLRKLGYNCHFMKDISEIKKFIHCNYDLILYHWYRYRHLWKFRKVFRNTPLVLHCHGSDVRNRILEPMILELSNYITYSTPDLAINLPKATFMPRIIDTGFWRRTKPYIEGTAFHVSHTRHGHQYTAKKYAQQVADKFNLDLTIQHDYPYTPHQFRDVLSQYEYYIDIKEYIASGKLFNFMSRIALEALSIGSKVWYFNKLYQGLPEQILANTEGQYLHQYIQRILNEI